MKTWIIIAIVIFCLIGLTIGLLVVIKTNKSIVKPDIKPGKWEPTEWPVDCKKGENCSKESIRDVICIYNGNKVDDKYCNINDKPLRYQACPKCKGLSS